MKWIVIFFILTQIGVGRAAADLVFRLDQNIHQSEMSDEEMGKIRKSSVNQTTGDLYPADPNGTLSFTQHIAHSDDRQLKNHSQFTSFSRERAVQNAFAGNTWIVLDVDRLKQDIDTGKVHGVRIHTENDIVQRQLSEISDIVFGPGDNSSERIAFLKYAMILLRERAEFSKKTGNRDPKLSFFNRCMNLMEKEYPYVIHRLTPEARQLLSFSWNALRFALIHSEYLIEGVIPKDYFYIEARTTKYWQANEPISCQRVF